MRRLVALSGAAILAVLVWVLLSVRPDIVPPPVVEASRSDPVESNASRPAVHELRAPAIPEAATTPAVFHGRCVAAETGAPLPDCGIRLRGSRRGSEAAPKWQDPAPVTSGADGGFRIEVLPHAALRFVVFITCAGRGPMQGVFEAVASGQDSDLGTVELQLGTGVAGSVADEDGLQVPNVAVRLETRTPPPAGRLGPRSSHRAVSGEDGALSFRELLPAGEWVVAVDDGREVVSPRQLVVPSGARSARLDVVLKRIDPKDRIAGRVLDETGAPADGVQLMVVSDSGGAKSNPMGRSRGDGTFELRRSHRDDHPVRIHASSTDRYEALADSRTFTWGTAGVEVRVRRSGGVEVFVTDGTTGRPVESFGVRCFPQQVRSLDQCRIRQRGRHENGRLLAGGAGLGKNVLVVVPDDPELLPSVPVLFERTDTGIPVVKVQLHRPLSLAVRVRRRDGTPVAGSRLELVGLHVGDRVLDLDTVSAPASEAFDRVFTTNSAVALVWSRATTAADGAATLTGPPAEGSLAVKVLGPGHVPFVHTGVVLRPGGAPLHLVVDAGATLHGKIGPLSAIARFRVPADAKRGSDAIEPTLLLARVRQGSPPRFPAGAFARGVPISATGTYRIEGIPPDTWDLQLRYSQEYGKGSRTPMQHFLTTVPGLVDGEVRELDVDLSMLALVRLHGLAFLDGAPLANREFSFDHRPMRLGGGGTMWASTPARTDERGAFAVEVIAGEYLPQVNVAAAGTDRRMLVSAKDWIAVSGPGDFECTVELQHRVARVVVFANDGRTPLVGRAFEVWSQGQWNGMRLETDGDGKLVVDPAPPAPFSLVAWTTEVTDFEKARIAKEEPERFAQLTLSLGPLRVADDQRESTFEVRMPAGR